MKSVNIYGKVDAFEEIEENNSIMQRLWKFIFQEPLNGLFWKIHNFIVSSWNRRYGRRGLMILKSLSRKPWLMDWEDYTFSKLSSTQVWDNQNQLLWTRKPTIRACQVFSQPFQGIVQDSSEIRYLWWQYHWRNSATPRKARRYRRLLCKIVRYRSTPSQLRNGDGFAKYKSMAL